MPIIERDEMGDTEIKCKECGATFVLVNGEREFYEDKSLNLPVHCPDCRRKRKIEKQERSREREKENNPNIGSHTDPAA